MNKFKLKKLVLLMMLFAFLLGISDNSQAAEANIINKMVYAKGPTFGTNEGQDGQMVRFYFDYEWLDQDETVYNPQLANALVLLTASSYSDSYVALDNNQSNASNPLAALNLLGMDKLEYHKYEGSDILTEDVNDVAGVALGYKKVTLASGKQINVVIAVSDTTEGIKEWQSNFDIGNNTDYLTLEGTTHSNWTNTLNHKGFDVSATREKTLIDTFIGGNIDPSLETKLVICGHSRGGALANLLGSKYIDEKNGETNNFDIFAYTFGTPNTTEITDTNNEAKLQSYNSIFNHVNEDDFVTIIPCNSWGFSRYGITKKIKLSDDNDLVKEFNELCSYDLASGYKAPMMDGMFGVGSSFAALFKNREDIYKTRTRTITFTNDGDLETYKSSKDYELLTITEPKISDYYKMTENGLELKEEYSYGLLLKAFADILANRNDSSAGPILRLAANVLLVSDQDIRKDKCNYEVLPDSKDTEISNLLGAMMSNVSNLPMPHYVCSYYILSMYEGSGSSISIIPVFDDLPYKDPSLGGGTPNPGNRSSSGSSDTKNAISKLTLINSDTLRSNKVTLILDNASAKKGKKVTFKAIPDSFITVKEIIIKDKDGNKVEVTHINGDEYSFIMPKTDIDIEIIYEEKIASDEEKEIDRINKSLQDGNIKLANSKREEKVVSNPKFIEGYEDGTLRLDDEVSNIELMCMITKLFDDKDLKEKEIDLNQGEDYWGEEVIRKANFLGLIPGLDDKENYNLNDKVTRSDMAKIIYDLICDDSEVKNKDICQDIKGLKNEKEITKLIDLGIIKGCEDGLFHGERTLTREEAIVIVNRTLKSLGFELKVDEVKNTFKDLSKDRWSYSEIIYATNN